MQRLARVAWTAALAAHAAIASAAGVPVDQASKQQFRAAQKTFQVADELYDAKRFEEALTAYRASYDIVASPNSRLMVARVLIELGRLGEAYRELSGTIAEAERVAQKDDKYRRTQSAARSELEALGKRVALLELSIENAPEGTRLSVGEREVELDALGAPLVLVPGTVTIVVTPPGGEPVRRELSLKAGTTSELSIDLTPGAAESAPTTTSTTTSAPARSSAPASAASVTADSSEPGSLRTWAWVAGGVGAAGLVTFGVFGTLNNSKFSDLESECKDGHCPPDRGGDIDSGRTYQTIANIGLIAGVVGIGAGATLFVLSSGEEKRASTPRPWLSVGPGSVHVGGRF